ncbi:MAG TPA: hypothetical protein VJ521_00130 [Acidobacteriota bacterium]|nr:hypothetical protein [Acidobacteriota bacterium]
MATRRMWFQKCAPNDGDLRRLENEARAAHRGLWIDRNPNEPWTFRLASA